MRMHAGEARGPIEASMQAKVSKTPTCPRWQVGSAAHFPRSAVGDDRHVLHSGTDGTEQPQTWIEASPPSCCSLRGTLTRLKDETHNRIAICFSVHARRGE